jgi:MYXO-CTERM domain-containing protein
MSSIRFMSRFAALAVAGAALIATSATAGSGLEFQLSVDGGAPLVFNPNGTDVGGGVSNYQGKLFDIGYTLSWDLNAKADPFVSGNIVVVNTGFVTQTYSLTILLPITPAITPSSLIGGSIAGSLTTDDDGGTLSSVGNAPIWEALIDGAVVASLLNSPFSVSNPGFGSTGIGPADFGTPIPSLGGPQALSTIGIRLTFSLTPGDQASFSSVFVVQPVPAPAALALLGLAGLAGGRRRRA